jgi:hypothetical protein
MVGSQSTWAISASPFLCFISFNKNKVYVLLQKQKPELYNITGIIELLEERFGLESACNISIILCLGGNDFLPKIGRVHIWLVRFFPGSASECMLKRTKLSK